VQDGALSITYQAQVKKFVRAVEQITFNGTDAVARRQSILYVTERCVFRLTATGLVLTEIAPGIDLKRDILSLMDFEPNLSNDLKLMDPRIFRDGPMSLRQDLVRASWPCDAHPTESN
jgi:propionate CoA-transferase